MYDKQDLNFAQNEHQYRFFPFNIDKLLTLLLAAYDWSHLTPDIVCIGIQLVDLISVLLNLYISALPEVVQNHNSTTNSMFMVKSKTLESNNNELNYCTSCSSYLGRLYTLSVIRLLGSEPGRIPLFWDTFGRVLTTRRPCLILNFTTPCISLWRSTFAFGYPQVVRWGIQTKSTKYTQSYESFD